MPAPQRVRRLGSVLLLGAAGSLMVASAAVGVAVADVGAAGAQSAQSAQSAPSAAPVMQAVADPSCPVVPTVYVPAPGRSVAPPFTGASRRPAHWLSHIDCRALPVYAAPASPSGSLDQSVTGSAGAEAGASGSYNWSGYAGDSVAPVRVTGTFTVPGLDGHVSGESSVTAWTGIGEGVTGDGLAQAGVEEDADCGSSPSSDCTVALYTWFEVYPQGGEYEIENLHVSPGNRMDVKVIRSSATKVTFIVCNVTRDRCVEGPLTVDASDPTGKGADWVVERPAYCSSSSLSSCDLLPLADFGTIKVSHAQTEVGSTFDSIQAARTARIAMVGCRGHVLDRTSALAATGTSFTETWAQAGVKSKLTC